MKVVEDVWWPAKKEADEKPGKVAVKVAVKVFEDVRRPAKKMCEAGARAWRRYNRRGSLDLWAI